jgi:hypothetical protein
MMTREKNLYMFSTDANFLKKNFNLWLAESMGCNLWRIKLNTTCGEGGDRGKRVTSAAGCWNPEQLPIHQSGALLLSYPSG